MSKANSTSDLSNEAKRLASGVSENQWAMFAHLSGLATFVVPFSNVIIPLIIWQVKKDSMKFASSEALEALNFQISLTIYSIIATMLMVILIGFPIIFGLMIFDIIMVIKAAINANKGVPTRYPITLRLVK